MLSSAIMAAEKESLEYVQIVSFGCGHDAYLSDEIVRMMDEISGKTPLILKVDESDIQGPLRIRVRSFLETIIMRREQGRKPEVHKLQDPYPVKFEKADRKVKTVLIPNTSHAFSRLMAAVFSAQGGPRGSSGTGARGSDQNGENDMCTTISVSRPRSSSERSWPH